MSTDPASATLVSAPVFELHGVSKVYPGSVPVTAVADVDLAVSAGEMVALTGPSGSGKSTLLGLLGLLDVPTGGTIRVAGSDASRLSDAARTRLRGARIGFVFQQFNLIPYLTALDNVAAALLYRGLSRRERRERAVAALERIGLGHRLAHRPPELSGGEQQRVAIARAVVTGPAAILADEPSGNLDSESTKAVLDLLQRAVAEGMALVVASHDPDVAARASRRIGMHDGRVREAAA